MSFELSDHALIRCRERQIPDLVLERILGGAFVAQALEDDGRVSNFHIVRVARQRYWIGVEREGVLVTVIHVGYDGAAPREWFSRRLLNFRHVIVAIEELPVTATRRLGRLRNRHQSWHQTDPAGNGAAWHSSGPTWGISA